MNVPPENFRNARRDLNEALAKLYAELDARMNEPPEITDVQQALIAEVEEKYEAFISVARSLQK